MPIIEKLNWDTTFFGYEIGKVNIGNIKLFNFDIFFDEVKKYSLVYVFSNDELQYSKFSFVDKKVILKRPCNFELDKHPDRYNFLSFNPSLHSSDQLIHLALQSGVNSRFFIDENFKKNEYNKLYKEWILKSISGEIAFDVLIATQDNSIYGLITIGKLNEKEAQIGLFAVDINARGAGIGKHLILLAINKCYKMGFDQINVTTQLNNIQAMNLYRKTNFIISETINIYHYWNL